MASQHNSDDLDPERDPSEDAPIDPYAADLPSDPNQAGNRPAEGARQLTAAEAAAMFPELGIDSQALEETVREPEPSPGLQLSGGGEEPTTYVGDDLSLVEPVDTDGSGSEVVHAGEGHWPSLDEDEEGAEADRARHAYSSPFDDEDDFATPSYGESQGGGGRGKALIALLGVGAVAAGAAIVYPRLSAPDSDGGRTPAARTDAPALVDGRRLVDVPPTAPEGTEVTPSQLEPNPTPAPPETAGSSAQWMGGLFSGGDGAAIAEVDPDLPGLLPKGSSFYPGADEAPFGETGVVFEESAESESTPSEPVYDEAFGGFGSPYLPDPFQDDVAVQHELARLLQEIRAEGELQWAPVEQADELAATDQPTPEEIAMIQGALASLSSDLATTRTTFERARSSALLAKGREHVDWAREQAKLTGAPSEEEGWAPLEDTVAEGLENEELAVEGMPVEVAEADPLEEAINALAEGELETELNEIDEPMATEPEMAELETEEPLDAEIEVADAEDTPPTETGSPGALGPVPNAGETEQALAQLEELDAQPTNERRTQELGFDDQLLLPSDPGGVGLARMSEMEHVWNSATLPEATIHSKTTLLTPAVGMVRLVCTNGEAFDGVLQSVGQGRLTLRAGLGSMAFDASDVAQIQRVGGSVPNMPHAEVSAKGERVRIQSPGGVISGRVISRLEGRITLLTDTGGRITLEDENVEPFRDEPRASTLASLPEPSFE